MRAIFSNEKVETGLLTPSRKINWATCIRPVAHHFLRILQIYKHARGGNQNYSDDIVYGDLFLEENYVNEEYERH